MGSLELYCPGTGQLGLRLWILLMAGSAAQSSSYAAEASAVLESSIGFNYDYVRKPIPRFGQGYFTSVEREHGIIRVWSRQGVQVLEQRLSLPGAHRVILTDVAASNSGQIAATGSAVDGLGRIARVIVWMMREGKVTKIVRTTPFIPHNASFDDDGTLWVLGRVTDDTGKDTGSFDTLRRYATDGTMVQSALPNTAFASDRVSPAYDAHLAICNDRVVVASLPAGQLAEVTKVGQLLGLRPLALGSARLTGLACAGNGAIAASLEGDKDIGQFVRYDRATSGWSPVSVPWRSPNQGLVLLGAEDGQWVIRTRPPIEVQWVSVN